MSKKRTVVALFVVAGAVLVLAGGLMASNMGFKLNKAILATGEGGSVSGTQTLCLPYNRQVGIDNVSELFADLGGYPAIQQISQWLTGADGLVSYAPNSPDFPLTAGEGYQIKSGVGGSYIVVGSHDPSFTVQLKGTGAGSLSGTQYYCPPYHATSSTASELFAELGGYPAVQQISQWLTTADGLVSYAPNSPDFDLVPGDAYQVKMGADQPYTPSHY